MAAVDTAKKTTHPKVLIADDDAPTRILLRAAISQWGYEVIEAKDGLEAWQRMLDPNAPRLMILDWLMPGMDGIALCERSKKELDYHPYIILLTQVTGTTNIVKGLEAGADEFLSKPFNMAELRSRLSIGERIIGYETALTEKNSELQQYVKKMKSLTGMVVEITDEIYSITNNDDFCKDMHVNAQHKKKLQMLQTNLQNIVDAIRQIPGGEA